MAGMMFIYAIFTALIILVVVSILVASGISAIINAYRRTFGKAKNQRPETVESRPVSRDSRRA